MQLENSKFCAIDIETTGLDTKKDEMIAFACVPIVNLKILVHDSFYTMINPKKYKIDAMKYHGISKDDLKTAPTFAQVAGRIWEGLDGILVGYCVEWDYAFLRRQLKSVGVHLKRDVVDIAMVEKWLAERRRIDNVDLRFEAMMRGYGLEQYYRHNAAADAFFAAQIFQIQMRKLLTFGVESAEKVIRLAKHCMDVGHTFAF
ncbi:MAG TPA: 3'-5' exonuclease [Thermodesulfobacteriota bacterium]|nr:3'-5' exonuclease [Thermodesulfobacteriota bacterium]